MKDSLSLQEAYEAMFRFLEDYYSLSNAEDVSCLLSIMQILEDNSTADPAIWKDWLDSVKKIISSR